MANNHQYECMLTIGYREANACRDDHAANAMQDDDVEYLMPGKLLAGLQRAFASLVLVAIVLM